MASSSQIPVEIGASQKKKRKSTFNDESDVQVIVSPPSNTVGPVFVNFPSIRPSKTIPFTLYSRTPESTLPLNKQPTLLAGETEDVEFFSVNGEGHGEGHDCSYLPAIYDPSTQQLHIHPNAPLYLLAHQVKRLKQSQMSSPSKDPAEYRARRNDLGETFGTRKAKNQIKAQERNKVDVRAMEGVKGHLMESIGEKVMDEEGPVPPSELIPIPNLETSDSSLVYPREVLIPNNEWDSISLSSFRSSTSDIQRLQTLPHRRSTFIKNKIVSIMNETSSSKKNTMTKYIIYLSSLFAFLDLSSQLHKLSGTELQDKLPGVSPQIISGLCIRFGEQTNGGKRWKVTEMTKMKLLAWICTICLAVDGWTTDVLRIASDLKMTPNKVVDIFKSLGCKVEPAPPPGTNSRKATLKAPVIFPKPKRRGPVQR
ncbi:hypothetical protein M231_03219 [Tremella mesenterica]|uniref:DNA-directed RNA polymerase I subunit RPA49 n=1 Tax=Tremella mesenterica TaxID=5217 RepID=A0A4Q1BP41_TREME|nr:uncharacterized protein TREMEDRAFT_62362 [Tremella mesenterica DSM 1558]EIW69501.1 hypothetical protein TREMEDRAFT_62362 [Tremella mesenterica DSM 1558]RXK39550.1 hypothetical protein M231_03219 [Tremella mesenterica]